jgi:assimilatory nitrate reductase catalytic subunit
MKPFRQLLRTHSGTMTADMVLHPTEFGLGRVPKRLQPVATTTSICGFCSTGCGLKIHLNRAGEAINLSPDPRYPVNVGMACPKGWEALAPLAATDRATSPLVRDGQAGEFRPVKWGAALETFTTRFKAIQQQHGPASVAVLSTGQIVVEEMALLGALFKFGMGGLHLDSNTRQCMATSHVAYKQAFGFDAPPYTYRDFEESDALIFIGANPCIAHPIMWQRVMMNRWNPDIVVIDPRLTETAQAATLHVGVKPKGDLTLLYGIAAQLIARGAINRAFVDAHTTGFDEFAAFVRGFTPDRVAIEAGVEESVLRRLVDIITKRERVSFWWTMGVNQSHQATRTAQAIINLALLTGNIGRPGTGANSITGQCNAMGSRLFGNATSLLGGYDFSHAIHREHVAEILGIDADRIPPRQGYAYDQILDAVERGEIRGLWIIATNTAHSWINQSRAQDVLRRLDFLVVQDMYATTETAKLAHLVLPAAGWGEKDGVLINSERRLGVVRKVRRAPGEALSDFSIFKLVAEAWGCGDMFRRWQSPKAVFQILKELSRGQPCDFSGIRDYAHLDSEGGIQWPFDQMEANRAPANPAMTHRRLFEDGRFFTADGRARFVFDAPQPLPESPDRKYPFLLLTGRGTSAQWHTGSRTSKSHVLRKLSPAELTAEINPADAARLEIANGDRVVVRSRRGVAHAVAVVTGTVGVGQIFLPMHFEEVNRLTLAAFDPHSRQPAYKSCAVAVEKPM